ncbi:MAG: hypothetical protein KC420_08785 [Myxococcales bacterium]|nr:hypothetical protein [Myxococcales bacterium]MCB9707126.1 hypothetical protein [Myxococcales bacterium]
MPDPEAANVPRWALRGPFRSVALAAALAIGAGGFAACGPAGGNDRWVTTENTNVDINWDAVKEAYLAAEGPEDLERRVNEIYEGDEIISVSVRDQDEKTQVVTGFFDKNTDGQVGEDEKIFSIQRDVVSPESAQVQMQGYGHYSYYHSPVWDIATGMMLGSMMSRAFMPSYRPLYAQPYTTSPARVSAISTQRSSYRAANPQRFAKRSSSGRSYGSKGGGFGGRSSTPTRRSGGGRFGLGDRGKRQRVRLSA